MIAERLAEVRQRIIAAAELSGRDPDEVTLIAVSKTHPPEIVSAAVAAGVSHLGENRIQEAAGKKPLVAPAATWHLIGPLQRNKARLALELFDLIHTVDRPELATRLQSLLASHWPERMQPVLIEVNVGDEPQKAGVAPDRLAELAATVMACRQLRLDGLMVIPPFDQSSEATRNDFQRLRELRDQLQQELGQPLPHLSMGMSHDYEMAIEEGATLVRVGTAIFGPRATAGTPG
jgi:pyridoxal phosphate enzyme (YggS family)